MKIHKYPATNFVPECKECGITPKTFKFIVACEMQNGQKQVASTYFQANSRWKAIWIFNNWAREQSKRVKQEDNHE